MRFVIITGVSLVMLAGCGMLGPSDKQALVSTCVEQGEAEATCECIASVLEKNLPPELFSKVADNVGRNKQNMIEFAMSLDASEAMAFAPTTNEMASCAENNATGE